MSDNTQPLPGPDDDTLTVAGPWMFVSDSRLTKTRPQDSIPGFKLLGPLGSGAMGEVYIAEDLACPRKVAIKVISPKKSVDQKAREQIESRFRREVAAAGRLHHPYIAQVYTAGITTDGAFFYAMQYIDGPTLSEASVGMSLRTCAEVVARVARALDYAHKHGVIHRDIKPSNIIIDRRGDPRLLDFGLAKIAGFATVTDTGSVLGTPAYIAPEIAQGRIREANHSVDIYSLGAVLYELLAGRAPFAHATTVRELIVLTASEDPPPIDELPGRPVPSELKELCGKAMARNLEDRYSSCGALARDLERWLGISAPRDHRAPARGNHFLIMMLSSLVALFLVVIVVLSWLLATKQP